jgi:excisionase family DNA binding protein|tara:strand:+ start:4939 stop:5166 length:228 start_codon:yes stop_codon:yes gene_type:complete
MENLYNKYDLTEILGLSISTIDNKMKDNSLGYYKFGKSVRFSEDQINEFLRKNNREKYTSSMITDNQVERIRNII